MLVDDADPELQSVSLVMMLVVKCSIKSCVTESCAGRMGQHSLKRTTSVTPKVSFGNPRASMDMQLPAVYISDDKGILSPMLIGRNPRRSMDSPRVFARPSSLFSPGPRDSEDGIKSGNVELVKALSGKPLTKDGSAQMIRPRNPQGAADHKSPRRPSQGPEGNQAVQQSSKSMDFSEFQRAMLLAGAKLVARTSSQGEEKKKVIPPPKLGKHLHAKPLSAQRVSTVLWTLSCNPMSIFSCSRRAVGFGANA